MDQIEEKIEIEEVEEMTEEKIEIDMIEEKIEEEVDLIEIDLREVDLRLKILALIAIRLDTGKNIFNYRANECREPLKQR
jgi:hypothetical protein